MDGSTETLPFVRSVSTSTPKGLQHGGRPDSILGRSEAGWMSMEKERRLAIDEWKGKRVGVTGNDGDGWKG